MEIVKSDKVLLGTAKSLGIATVAAKRRVLRRNEELLKNMEMKIRKPALSR
jgi:hypothetical protein